MSDFEQQLKELEDTIGNNEEYIEKDSVKKEEKPKTEKPKIPLLYIVSGLIPIVIAAILYFTKPRWITYKKKTKYLISWQKLLILTAVITALLWGILYGLVRNGILKLDK